MKVAEKWLGPFLVTALPRADGNGWKVVDGYFGYLMDFHGFPIAFFVYSEKCGNDSHDFGFLICITATFFCTLK